MSGRILGAICCIAQRAFATAGWVFASWIGFAFPLVALIFFLTEWRRTSAESPSRSALAEPTETDAAYLRAELETRNIGPAPDSELPE